jgi:protein ImuB
MALAEARALAGDLEALPWDEAAIARAALEVTAALLEASPRVSREPGLGVWWVDASGLGDERRLAGLLSSIAGALRFGPARCGIAGSAIAAHAATLRRGRRTTVVPPGGDAACLAPFPIALLDPGEELAQALRALGITRAGQLAALTSEEVESRFGLEGLAAHRLARGLDTRGPTTPRDDSLPLISADLGGPVATAEPLLFVLKGAIASLAVKLRARGLAARELTVTLGLDDGGRTELPIRPARPTTRESALFDHARAAFEKWQIEAPAVSLELRASLTVPASGEQGNLLVTRWADPAALAGAFDRIRGREGELAVAVPETRDAHLPREAGRWADGQDGLAEGRKHGRAKPADGRTVRGGSLRLLAEPQPIRVRLGRGGIEAFRHEEAWFDVNAWAGPDRLAPPWWRPPAGTRDYYIARARDGTLWLLYRAARERAWYVEGWWD